MPASTAPSATASSPNRILSMVNTRCGCRADDTGVAAAGAGKRSPGVPDRYHRGYPVYGLGYLPPAKQNALTRGGGAGSICALTHMRISVDSGTRTRTIVPDRLGLLRPAGGADAAEDPQFPVRRRAQRE